MKRSVRHSDRFSTANTYPRRPSTPRIRCCRVLVSRPNTLLVAIGLVNLAGPGDPDRADLGSRLACGRVRPVRLHPQRRLHGAAGTAGKKRGLGEPDVFVVWGPLMVCGTYYSAVRPMSGWKRAAGVAALRAALHDGVDGQAH